MMETRVLPADRSNIAAAGQLIRKGNVVAFPTETVYGLGASAFNARAIQKIFDAKGRPGDNPLIVHISTPDQIFSLIKGEIPGPAMKLIRAGYWPGPLTMIMEKSVLIPDAVSAGLSTVGIRVPSHPAARALLYYAGVPIAAPSANRSGRPSPTTAEHVLKDMNGRIPLILDGGPCEVGLESTVLDVTCEPARILRPGGVTAEMIAQVLGEVEVDGSVMRPLDAGEAARSPGMKYRHYAPRAAMTVVKGKSAAETISALYDESVARGDATCILALTRHVPLYGDRNVRALGDNADEAAARFFSALREMDERNVERIFTEAISPEGMGLAVMNRMGRAAAFDVIDTDG